MNGEIHTIVNCSLVGCCGVAACYVLEMFPQVGQAKQLIRGVIGFVTLVAVLRTAGLL